MTRFELNDAQLQRVADWKHECFSPSMLQQLQMSVTIGESPVSYRFRQTSVGVIVKALCACGEEMDLTEYDKW